SGPTSKRGSPSSGRGQPDPRLGLAAPRPPARVTTRPTTTTRLRWPAFALIACVVVAACEPATSPAPTTRPPTSEASAGPTDVLPPTRPPSSHIPTIPFADALRDALDVAAIA